MVGLSGQLRRGTATAATLGRWTLGGGDGGLVVQAAVVTASDYWLSQRPLDLALDVGARVYRWKDVTLQSHGGTGLVVVARGRPERT